MLITLLAIRRHLTTSKQVCMILYETIKLYMSIYFDIIQPILECLFLRDVNYVIVVTLLHRTNKRVYLTTHMLGMIFTFPYIKFGIKRMVYVGTSTLLLHHTISYTGSNMSWMVCPVLGFTQMEWSDFLFRHVF